MTDDNVHNLRDDEETPEVAQKVEVGLSPLGKVSIQVTDSNGVTAAAQMTAEQTWTIIGHLQALTNMLIQAAYQQAAQQRMEEAELLSKLHIPGKNR
jgi:hypothetical protein